MYRYRLHFGRYQGLIAQLIGSLVLFIIFVMVGIHLFGHRNRITTFDQCIAAGFDASDSDPQTCTDGHTTFVARQTPIAPVTSAGTSQDYDILVSGDSRSTYPAGTVAITDQAGWAAYWAKVHAQIKPTPPLIPVDFSQKMVVAITMGQEPTSGYGLEFSGFVAGSTAATANYEAISPSSACTVADHLTSPYLIIQTAKVAVPVQFKATPKQNKC